MSPTILQARIKAKLHPNNFHKDALVHILFFPLNKWHALCCLQFPSSPRESWRMSFLREFSWAAQHTNEAWIKCQQTCWDGWFAVNKSSVGEESPSRKMPSCEQFMVSVWVCSPAALLGLSHHVFIAAHGSGVPNPLGHTLKASWLQRTAQIFGNCHGPVTNLPCLAVLWIYTARLVHLWFAPQCLWSLLMISLPTKSLALHLSPGMSWERGPHTHHLQLPRRCICTDTGSTHFLAEILCGQCE